MSYEGTNTNPHNLVTEDDLNDLIQFLDGNVNAGYIDSYSIEPAAWSGSGEYTVTTVYTDVQPYSDTGFTTLQEEKKNGNIRNLKWCYDESEVTGDALSYYQDYLDSSYQELTPMKRATVGMSNYTVTAKDESGNETQATVFIWSHRHNLKSVAAVPGDCVHTGTKAYYICTGCGEKFEDASGTIPAGDLTTPVQANNHSYGGWKQTKNPTALSEGVNTRVCSRCGHAENRAVAKLPAKIALSVGKIKVDKTTVPLKKGQSFAKITAVMTTGDKLAEATSNKPKVVKASVNASTGKVTLKALKKTGKATITVKTAAGATTIFKVKVQKKKVVAKKIVGFKKKLTLKKGRKYKIPADVSPVSTPDRMKFKSAKKNIAAVSTKGIITAKKKGKATITVTIGKKKFKCIVTVK